MPNTRLDVLKGFQAATRFHQQAGVRQIYVTRGGRIDVYRLAADLQIPVMFRDLDGLLGAYLPDPYPGILLTKKRPVSVQRLTCAHELGHYYLKHEESIDAESDIGFALTGGRGSNERERQADAFAFSFLMPKWLLIDNLHRLGESGLRLDAATPIEKALVVYQLSLRVGCSYAATIATLQHFTYIPHDTAEAMRAIEPRKIKEHLLAQVMIPDWHRDVWLVTEADNGVEIDAAPEDIFVVRVRDPSTAGFRTKLTSLEQNGFTILKEGHVTSFDFGSQTKEEVVVGTFPLHETVAQHSAPGQTAIHITQGRPWDPPEQTVVPLHIDLDLQPAPQGLSNEERRSRLSLTGTHD